MFTNINISKIKEIVTPSVLIDKYMPSVTNTVFIEKARLNIQSILNGWDKKLIVIVGPCSIHDYDLAKFPFDRQRLKIYFEDADLNLQQLKFVDC